jgi:hypothetical protein
MSPCIRAAHLLERSRVRAMGYELVEGRLAGGFIGKKARLDFAPAGKC